jgi:WD40 repeat protein
MPTVASCCIAFQKRAFDRPAFTADGKQIAMATDDTKVVRIWDVASGNELHSWQVDQPIFSFALSPDGKQVAAGFHDGTILHWDTSENDAPKRSLKGHTALVNTLRFAPDGQSLVSSSHDGTIRVWSPRQERVLKELIELGPSRRPLTIELNPSGQYLFATGESPLVFILRLKQSD